MRMNNHTNLISNPVFITLAAHVRFLHLVKNLPEEWKKQKNVTSTDFGNSLSNNSNFPSNENEIKDFIFNNGSASNILLLLPFLRKVLHQMQEPNMGR